MLENATKNDENNSHSTLHSVQQVGKIRRQNPMDSRTLRSTTDSGKSNSPIIQSGMAPPQGLALSILRSKKTVSIFFSCAKISAAQAPEGPPPTTATLYFISNIVVDVTPDTAGFPRKLEAVKADTVATQALRVARKNFMMYNDKEERGSSRCDGREQFDSDLFLRPPHKLKLKSKELLVLRHA
jgi:hypothetical protein